MQPMTRSGRWLSLPSGMPRRTCATGREAARRALEAEELVLMLMLPNRAQSITRRLLTNRVQSITRRSFTTKTEKPGECSVRL